MFSFHRPKVYRSSTGCCICKAKSSSSRFTDSKKYEEDFMECFKLETPRQGEICNACVLLVKRWKKLPAGSDRNWQHVVDARAGPGMKSFTKFKTKNKKLGRDKSIDKIKKKHFEREYSPVSDKSDPAEDDIHEMDYLEDGTNMDHSPSASDVEDTVEQKGRRRKGIARRRDDLQRTVTGFIDFDYWKPEVICCGMIFRGQNDEIIVDPSYLKPCSGRLARCQAKKATSMSPPATTEVVTKGVYSDSSSDSGYDDCSNQGIAMSPEAQGTNVSETGTVPVIQVNRVQATNMIIDENQVKSKENLIISRQVADLMCHETMFPSKERSSPVSIMGHFQPEETAISH